MSGNFIARKIKRLAIPSLALAGLVLAGVVVPSSAPAAVALPGRCGIPYVQWHNGPTYTWEDADGNSHGVSPGVKGSVVVDACDVIEGPAPGDGGGGGGGGGETPPGPPPPPGDPVPAPPPSLPAAAGPLCAPGANNHVPGVDPVALVGDGSIEKANVALGEAAGWIERSETSAADRLNYPGLPPTRFWSADIDVTPSSGGADANPYAGLTPEQAAQALNWPGGVAPSFTEVGGVGGGVKLAARGTAFMIRLAERALANNAASRRLFLELLGGETEETRIDVFHFLYRALVHAKTNLAPWQADIIEDFIHDATQFLDLASGPASDPDPTELYRAEAKAVYPGGGGAGDASSCGHVMATASTSMTSTTVAPVEKKWVHVTLVGTKYGTLINELNAMTAGSYCPPVELSATAGQVNGAAVTLGCTVPIASARLLTRSEISAKEHGSEAERVQIAALSAPGSDLGQDAMARAVAFRPWGASLLPGDTFEHSVSALADGNAAVSMSADGNGQLYYKPPVNAGGGVDGLVVSATDTAGVEHLFLVKVAVKSPPTCLDGPSTRFVGDDHTVVVQGGTLEVVRGKSFTIDPKSLCSTDYRDSYRVEIETGIKGTSATANPDGTVTFTWTDNDIVGANSSLKITAWDEQSGVPSNTVDIPIDVRDVTPVCEDVSVEYDLASMKGEPLAIPLNCTMKGGLKVLSPRIPRLVLGDRGGAHLTVSTGELTASTSGLVFTPNSSATSGTIIAVQTVAWNMDPWGPWNPFNAWSEPFTVAVTMR